jgi:hypothetical protein
MFKKIVSAIAISSLAMIAAPTVALASEQSVVSVKASDYSKKKKNQFWKVVTAYDPLVRYAGKKSTIALGVSTCDLLRAGGDVYDLALLVYELDAGIAEDSVIAVMSAAPVILCPDQSYKFD